MSAARARRPFRRSPRRLDLAALYQYALSALSRQARSTADLRRRLAERARNPADVALVLGRLTGAGLLDDRRYALLFAGFRAHARRWGRYRIARELRRRGVAEEFITAALAEVFPSEADEVALVRAEFDRRLRPHQPPFTEKVLRRAYQSLLRRGFSSAIILAELRRRRRPETARPALGEVAETE